MKKILVIPYSMRFKLKKKRIDNDSDKLSKWFRQTSFHSSKFKNNSNVRTYLKSKMKNTESKQVLNVFENVNPRSQSMKATRSTVDKQRVVRSINISQN